MADSGKRAASRPAGSPTRGRRILKWSGISLLVLAVLGAVGFGIFYALTPIPDPNKDFQTANTHLYYKDGKSELGTLSVQNREQISYTQMPQNVKDAIVAAENPTFWTDPGISVPGMIRALTTVGRDNQGGSTLTQQYVKVLYLSQEKTLTRKLKEIVIALKTGQEVPKEKILEGYLNTVYFGRGAYGIQAASQAYFGVDAAQVNQQQAIVLAAIVNSPGTMDPALGAKQKQNLLERYQYTINSLVKMDKMTEEQKAAIYTQLPEFPAIKRDPRFGGTDGYLMKLVIEELKKLGFDDATINGGGLEVTTTFDAKDQAAAVKVAQDQTKAAASERKKDPAQLHASIVSIDNATGGVLAMYAGNPDYVQNTRNWALTTSPTGSTFKTWALVAALREGFSLDTMLKGYTWTPKGDSSPVTNAGGESFGNEVSLRDATTHSVNTAYVDLTTQLKGGPQAVVKAANDAGIPTAEGWAANDRVALGVAEETPTDNASGYSTLANSGTHLAWHTVVQVKDKTGAVVYNATPKGDQTIAPEVANAATDCLASVAESGTGRRVAALDYPVAGKTGTRYDGVGTRASWFVGYTKQITTAVNFVAGDSGQENLDEYSSGFYGSGYPAATWLAYMKSAMSGLPALDFPKSTYTPTKAVTAAAPISTPEPSFSPSDAFPGGNGRTPNPQPLDTPGPTRTSTTTRGTSPQPTQGGTTSPASPGSGGRGGGSNPGSGTTP